MTHVLYANAAVPSTDPRHWLIEPLAFPTRFNGWPAKLEGGRVVTDFEKKATGDPETLAALQAAAAAVYDMLTPSVDLAQAAFQALEAPAYAERRRAEREAKDVYTLATGDARDHAAAVARQRWETVLSVLPR